jgi:hypothetical protein
MKTNDLISALAADNATRAASVERWLLLALLAATAVSVVLFSLMLGPRADIAVAAGQFGFWFKFAVTLTLAATAGVVATRLVRPGAEVAAVALGVAPLLLAAAVAAELTQVAPAMRVTKLVGTTWQSCLTFIPLLSAPILFAALVALRHGAPTRPALTGAVAGLLAGGLGATVYASYCVEDSAFFLMTWYSLAIAIVALVGSAAGARLLRW